MSVFEKLRFRWPFSPDTCGRHAKPEKKSAIHSTKISGNFGPKLNGLVRSNRKSFEKAGPPFEVDYFSRSDRLEFWLNGLRPQSSFSNKNGYVPTVRRASKRKGTVEWVLKSWTNDVPFLLYLFTWLEEWMYCSLFQKWNEYVEKFVGSEEVSTEVKDHLQSKPIFLPR